MAAAAARGVALLPASGFAKAGHEAAFYDGDNCAVTQCKLDLRAQRHPQVQASLKDVFENKRKVVRGLGVKNLGGKQRRRTISVSDASASTIGGGGGTNGGDGGLGNGGGGANDGSEPSDRPKSANPLSLLLEGWRERVEADPSFPFKVLTEQVIGVTASVLGDMAGRPHFGLYELDFVFSTIIVGSILNFSLMYLLAPTLASAGGASLPGIFHSCPPGHMFEPGSFGLLQRGGTFLFKGVQFAVIGFAAGLVGTGMTNMLLKLRKKMDPDYKGNDSPPLVLNAATWALHMGLSSNLRYQALNGLEFLLAPKMNPSVFKTGVFILRTLNNVGGGASFSTLAKMTGSQKAASSQEAASVQ